MISTLRPGAAAAGFLLAIAASAAWTPAASAHSTTAHTFWSQPKSHYKGKSYWSGNAPTQPTAAQRSEATKKFFAPTHLPLNGKGVGY